MQVEEKRKLRLVFLKKLYDLSGGNPSNLINMYKVGELLDSIQKDEVYSIAKYLHEKGLIKIQTTDGEVSLTSYGIDEIEEATVNPSKPTEYFPPINIISIENMTNSSILQGSKDSLQNIQGMDKDLKKAFNEGIIRGEANEFALDQVEIAVNKYNGHKSFISLIKGELERFYDPEAKMIFLDQIKKNVEAQRKAHTKECGVQGCCDIDKTYEKITFLLEQEFQVLPRILHKSTYTPSPERTKVFISYARNDKGYLDDLRRHFKPIEKYIIIWDDSKIMPGKKWREEIGGALEDVKIAVLLISADFFNSEFIANNELPPLLEAAEKEGVTILSVILKPCLFDEYPEISQYQAVNNPSFPISAMDETQRETTWVELVKQIKRLAIT